MTREVWLRWLKRFFPDEEIGVMTGKAFDPSVLNKKIIFGHYAVLPSWATAHENGTLIFDEVHALANPRSKRSIAASLIASRAQKVIGVSGTPIWNRPKNLWFILSLLAPGAFGSYEDFGKRYCDGKPTEYGWSFEGASYTREMELRLSQIKIRRLHSDVEKDLPQTTREVIIADITPAQRRRLDLAAEGLRRSLRTNTAGELSRYRAVLGEVKIDVTIERALKILQEGEPLVVWTWHKGLCELMRRAFEAHGIQSFVVNGDVASNKREERLDAWKRTGGQDIGSVLLITIPTGREGIDLSFARFAVVMEVDYIPAMMGQVDYRIFDITRSSHLIYVVADHISDRRIVDALHGKLAMSDSMGLGAAGMAINVLYEAFDVPADVGDIQRLMAALLEYEEGVV